MATFRSGWVLRPRIVIGLQFSTEHLCLVATRHRYMDRVVGPIHARSGTLDLLMNDVPDIVRVAVVARIDNSDHSSL